MRKLLHIGEIAQLLGMTPKAIRHYQKIGLLAEPERTEAGYRLYNVQDLLRLQRIGRLQSFGLSLKQIKRVLGDPKQEHTLREVLQALDEELVAQIRVLEERRKKIRALLDENVLDALDQPPAESPTWQFVQEQLDEYHTNTSPAVWEIETQLYSYLDSFHWSPDHQQAMRDMAQCSIQYVTEHPEEYQQLLALAGRFAALSSLPEDAPEVEQLTADFARYFERYPFLLEVRKLFPFLEQISNPESPFAHIASGLITPVLSPAQLRVRKAWEHTKP
jgi:DNA-binding transcriptional MerR regulator